MAFCIWYVSKYVITPEPGDPAGRAYGLMREFARLGYNSVLITSDSMGKYNAPPASQSYVIEQRDGITLCRARTLKYGDSNTFRRVLSWFDFERKLFRLPKRALPEPDVVVVSSLSLLTVFNGLRLRRRYRCRLVFEVRDIWPLTMVEEGGYSARNPFVRILGAIERLGYRSADAIVGTMPNLGQHVEKVTGSRLPVHCIPMGVDLEALSSSQPLPSEFAESHVPSGKFIVGYAGSIGISNAMDVFFQCIELMQDEDGIHFVVLGDGELRSSYVSRYGGLPNLTFVPRIPKSQVHDFLVRCDLLYLSVHKSEVWDYGLSLNKLIDYMLAAKPVIASYSGYPSMINEADCGVFVPAGDSSALRQEFNAFAHFTEEDRIVIGARGRDWLLKNRGYETLAQDFLKVLRVSD
jgi:glycosyltransferase involved in cell wall biosynthesis